MCLTVTSGCDTVKRLNVFTTEVKRQPLNLDPPPPEKMEPLNFVIITQENYLQVFEELKKNKTDPVLFGLTDDGYETLALNFAKTRKYIILNRHVLEKYKEYYEKDEEPKPEK